MNNEQLLANSLLKIGFEIFGRHLRKQPLEQAVIDQGVWRDFGDKVFAFHGISVYTCTLRVAAQFCFYFLIFFIMEKLLQRGLGQVQDIAGEYIFSAVVQVLIVRFWKRMLIPFVAFAWGAADIFAFFSAKIKEFSLEKVLSEHPLSVLLFSIFALWLITIPLGKKR